MLGLLAFRLAEWARGLDRLASDAAVGTGVVLFVVSLAAGFHDLAILPLFPLLVAGLYGNRGRIGRLIGCKALYGLGVVSYSVYLVHPYFVVPKKALVDWAQGSLPGPEGDFVASVTVYAAVLLTSGITYRCIEEPGRRYVNRLADVLVSR